MQKIKILSENLSNMIAAGEVVERPFSVVKELVENSIDAGSSRIDILIKEGGKRLVRIADNGSGMSREDLLLSLERHATSKLGSADDLFNITTMGFRGEALASIASVSKMTIASKEHGAIEGTELISEAGEIRDLRSAGLPGGTIIEVKNLFFNTPARKKFLKTTATEMGHISDYIVRTALAFPAIGFSLHGDKGVVHDFPAGGSIEERVKLLFGREIAGQLLAVEEEHTNIRISGFITPPSIQRSSSSGLYLYVNGRFVRDKVMRHALLQAYESFIMKGKYPLTLLFLEVEPSAVDVNVHPAKSEVKFHDSSRIHDLTRAAIYNTLQKKQWLGADMKEAEALSQNRTKSIKDAASAYIAANEPLDLRGGHTAREESRFYGQAPPPLDGMPIKPDAKINNSEGVSAYFSSLDVIGQAGEMYIICEGRDGLVLIDQHAAYERIAFETLKSGYNGKDFQSQNLLVPETVELTPKEAAVLEENLADIGRLGFEIESFGGNSFIVSAVPAILGTRSVKTIIADMASELCDLGRSKTFASALDDVLKRIACHSVVRGRRRMSHEEMRNLLGQMDSSGIVPHCPHGRPAHIDITISDIEKRFERA